MSSMSRGKAGKAAKAYKVVKPKKSTKHTTPHTRNHRFKSFNDRIASLKIDPVRRRRYVEGEEKEQESTHTYFGTSLEQWKDTNLSATFTSFAKEVSPLCDNLAVVLYNEEKIMDVLVKYIEKADALAMEPLLNLLSQFAHDLDTKFEVHFQRAVATVTAVAAKHSDFAVIEWSFTCLAWLFKYFSRLLTPDLRPLYDLMAPYLGKEAQKPFIVRFTAEALSFLVRKAALVYEKDKEPLDLIMEHMLQDCVATPSDSTASLQQQGVMTLLTEAIKGIQYGVHASASAVLSCLFRSAGGLATTESQSMDKIATGILTSLIHSCNPEGFAPVLDTTLNYVGSSSKTSGFSIRFCASLLFTVVSVRKGTRIQDWKPITKLAQEHVAKCQELEVIEAQTVSPVLGLLSVSMQTATIDAVLSIRQVVDVVRTGKLAPFFIQFCDMVSRLGKERFENFVLPAFQKFVLDAAQEGDMGLYSLIPRVALRTQDAKLKCPHNMLRSIIDDLKQLTGQHTTDSHELLARANLKLKALVCLTLSEETKQALRSSLLKLVHRALENTEPPSTSFCDFALSVGFEQLLHLQENETALESLWIKLCNASPNYIGLSKFWSNLLRYVKSHKPNDLGGSHLEALDKALVSCLASSSHSIRQDTLDIISMLYQLRGKEATNLLSIAVTIESIPITLETERSLSMNIRRLAPAYSICNDDLLLRAIPKYCFGLLHLRLSKAWDDATTALAGIVETKAGEEAVMEMVQAWLDSKPDFQSDDDEVPAVLDVDTDGFKVFSDFECPNLAKLAAITEQVFLQPTSGLPAPAKQLSIDQERSPIVTATARSQALRVLNKMPQLAEKRSRILVPILLKWAGTADEMDPESEGGRWSRKDQKALLAIFAQFGNPKVLYKSDEVYSALLALSANGDVEIQRSALKAIMAWKNKSVTRYEEHLNNLLDEDRFREELSVFLREEVDEEEGISSEDHTHLMPVMLRLLYGRAVSGGKEGQSGRRKAIFVALSRFGNNVLEQFIDIALSGTAKDHAGADTDFVQEPKAPLRQQFGMLNMINDMLQVLGAELEPSATKLVQGILSCTVSASRRLDQDDQQSEASLLRTIRSAGMQCLVKTFDTMSGQDLKRYGKIIVDDLLVPRLERFANENAQGVSGTLRLFAAWSARNATIELLTSADGKILHSIAHLLQRQHTKDEVRVFILKEILDNLVQQDLDHTVLQPHVSSFVTAIGAIIKGQPSKAVLDASVQSFAKLAAEISSGDEAADVTKTCTGLLTKPSKDVSPWTKTGLLRTLLPLVQRSDVPVKDELYSALSGLFSRLRGVESRALLAQVLATLVKDDEVLARAAKACEDMNAMGTRLDEPNHERREQAFTWIYESSNAMSLEQWLPVVHNCLYYIRDSEDRVNRSSASHALQLFVDAAAQHIEDDDWKVLLDDAVYTGIEHGVKEQSELVRAEYLQVLGHLVEKLSTWQKVSNMYTLAVGGDEEASFFNNILHIQQHRRLRALRRLTEEAGNLSSSNVSRILLPLLEHFVFDAIEGDSGRTLTDQAVQTIGALATVLNQSAFRATFKRYTAYLKSKVELEKTVLRLLGAMVDGARASQSSDGAEDPASDATTAKASVLSSKAVISEQLPPLLAYLHQKDESTVDRRMPVAVTIVKLMLALPENEFAARLPAVLTDVSHVFRSRSQEARDETRKALKAVSSLVGPNYFSFILRELRSALKRGYQLHVLSFTVHALLVDAKLSPGDLDECLPDLMAVIMDDIFGVTGQEKDAEEYKSGMKEVKSSKSYDTMEHLARITPIRKLGELVRPIRSLLSERLDLKSLKKIDELLTRLRKGVDENPASDSRDMLSFCWEIVSQVYQEEAAVPAAQTLFDERRKRFLVQLEAPKGLHEKSTTTSYRFKLVSFALNLLRKALRRHEDLQTPQNLAGFLPMAGDALIQGQEEVKLSAVRLLSTIMRVPIKKLDDNAPVYVKEAVAMIKGAPNMTTDSVKAALELITSVLREKRTVEVKEKDMALLLKRLKTDIDEPDRQGVIYKFLRSVLGRKILITEVYELMDEVGKAMVTNPDRSIRESARSAYLQFVMEYPQGKDRWQKQTSFLVGNLQYQHASGRQSVMEFLHQMLGKIGDDVLAETSPRIFVSLLPVLVSDTDNNCRDMAKLLVGRIFERAGGEQLKQFLTMMETWLKPEKKAAIKAGALQCWSVLMRSQTLPQKQLESLRDKLEDILSDFANEETIEQPRLILDTLQAMSVLVETAPAVGLGRDCADLWKILQKLPARDSVEVQESVATLLGKFFDDIASYSSKTEYKLAGLPLRGSGGVELGAEDMRSLRAVNLQALRAISLGTSETLTVQIIRNLVFLGRCFDANQMPSSDNVDQESDEEEASEEDSQVPNKTALANLLRRLSSMLMADKFSVMSRTTALQTVAALINQIENIPDLQVVLRPLYALTDPTVPKPPGDLYKALEDKARETMDLIQKKIGSQAYVAALASARTEAKNRRDERRQKRRIEAVSAPEKWASGKKRKYEAKKVKIKAKGQEARGMRRGW
ncbi:U3 small nucleolar RNA-associated protein 20 [Fulvia fulva]|nr:U3 small nucleolar RNA-associated protein 20 [Fulvia fulva]KAK4614415.1 U3 small nucleolar RNA-associated protein 20 [Fulvia fulva]WPV20760.1 U3 small nucleolar RNA-associated protein 20 [Fulvia fulva]WPV34786.1 U3 small nucleolar RNA-associated protein 20 [Fulvia fulva]